MTSTSEMSLASTGGTLKIIASTAVSTSLTRWAMGESTPPLSPLTPYLSPSLNCMPTIPLSLTPSLCLSLLPSLPSTNSSPFVSPSLLSPLFPVQIEASGHRVHEAATSSRQHHPSHCQGRYSHSQGNQSPQSQGKYSC